MSKFVKNLVQKEYEDKFEGMEEFVVIDSKGVGGNSNNEFRGALKEKGINVTVVKNSMMCKALENLGLSAASSLFLAGPSSVVYGGDSIVDLSKEVVNWSKKLKPVDIKGGFVEGSVVDDAGVVDLSKMPTRVELQGELSMLAQSPGRRIAGCAAGPGGIIAGCIKGLVEKLEKEAA
jgi:large subunit ribosomal protein L10